MGRAARQSQQTPNDLYRQYAPWVAAALLVGVVGLGCGRWRSTRGPIAPAGRVRAVASSLRPLVLLRGHETFGREQLRHRARGARRAGVEPEQPIYAVRLLDHTLPFYLRHASRLVETPGELEFGVGQEPQKWIPTLDAFISAGPPGPARR